MRAAGEPDDFWVKNYLENGLRLPKIYIKMFGSNATPEVRAAGEPDDFWVKNYLENGLRLPKIYIKMFSSNDAGGVKMEIFG